MSDYDMCSCDFDSDEDVSFSYLKMRRARKEYVCEECSGAINPGDEYEYGFWAFHGGGTTYCRTCKPCVDGPFAFVRKNCGCWEHGGDWLYDHLSVVFREYAFTKPGVRFRVGRMLVEMRQRGAAARKVAA